MLDPQSFVRHLHTDRENQTCHWGFDAAHWRSYVHISDAYYKKSNTKEATTTESSASDSENRPMTPSSSSEEKPTVDRVQSLLDEIKKRFNHPKLTRKQVGLYDFSISIQYDFYVLDICNTVCIRCISRRETYKLGFFCRGLRSVCVVLCIRCYAQNWRK